MGWGSITKTFQSLERQYAQPIVDETAFRNAFRVGVVELSKELSRLGIKTHIEQVVKRELNNPIGLHNKTVVSSLKGLNRSLQRFGRRDPVGSDDIAELVVPVLKSLSDCLNPLKLNQTQQAVVDTLKGVHKMLKTAIYHNDGLEFEIGSNLFRSNNIKTASGVDFGSTAILFGEWSKGLANGMDRRKVAGLCRDCFGSLMEDLDDLGFGDLIGDFALALRKETNNSLDDGFDPFHKSKGGYLPPKVSAQWIGSGVKRIQGFLRNIEDQSFGEPDSWKNLLATMMMGSLLLEHLEVKDSAIQLQKIAQKIKRETLGDAPIKSEAPKPLVPTIKLKPIEDSKVLRGFKLVDEGVVAGGRFDQPFRALVDVVANMAKALKKGGYIPSIEVQDGIKALINEMKKEAKGASKAADWVLLDKTQVQQYEIQMLQLKADWNDLIRGAKANNPVKINRYLSETFKSLKFVLSAVSNGGDYYAEYVSDSFKSNPVGMTKMASNVDFGDTTLLLEQWAKRFPQSTPETIKGIGDLLVNALESLGEDTDYNAVGGAIRTSFNQQPLEPVDIVARRSDLDNVEGLVQAITQHTKVIVRTLKAAQALDQNSSEWYGLIAKVYQWVWMLLEDIARPIAGGFAEEAMGWFEAKAKRKSEVPSKLKSLPHPVRARLNEVDEALETKDAVEVFDAVKSFGVVLFKVLVSAGIVEKSDPQFSKLIDLLQVSAEHFTKYPETAESFSVGVTRRYVKSIDEDLVKLHRAWKSGESYRLAVRDIFSSFRGLLVELNHTARFPIAAIIGRFS